MSRESIYNASLTEATLNRQESINPNEMNLLTYGRPSDTCNGFESGKLGNMAGGFGFDVLGLHWYATEMLYLCGEWSNNTTEHKAVQERIRKQKSGVRAYSIMKANYSDIIRPNFPDFRFDWMLWCVWQKCIHNTDFKLKLKSVPDDCVIVEVVERDPRWAMRHDENGMLVGCNAMGKILTICRRCLKEGTTPNINKDLLNKAGIYILGERVKF